MVRKIAMMDLMNRTRARRDIAVEEHSSVPMETVHHRLPSATELTIVATNRTNYIAIIRALIWNLSVNPMVGAF